MTIITRHRPKSFDEVIGQDSAVKALQRAIAKGTNKTFLFTGEPGLGKTTLARIAAHEAGCKSIDVIEIDAATNTGIDDMRAVAETMSYAPLEGDCKAIIIDEAHALSKAAVQSLLKVFEEPPEWGLWFMCTTEPTKVPVAIRNRCMQLALKPVAPYLIVGLLKKVAKAEKIKTTEEIIKLCSEEALGSPRAALVNLSAVGEAENVKEAKELLQTAADSKEAIDLARMLSSGNATWKSCQALLREMKGLNGDSVRHVVRAYATTLALSIPSGPKLTNAIAVLEAFEKPCNPQDGMSPIVVRCAHLLL